MIGLRNPPGVERLLRAGAAAAEETGYRAFNRRAGIDRRGRKGGADLGIAGGVIEVPVGVDDRGDRPAALAGKSEIDISAFSLERFL